MDEQLLAALKALADASRLAIVGLLAKQPRSVDELAAAMGLSAPTVSHHLSKLAQAGLVEMHAEQYYSVYSLRPEALDGIGKRIMAADRDETLTSTTDEGAYERAVIAEYVRPNGAARFPNGLKKVRALLHWVGANKFARGVRYTEAQVEDILRQSFFASPDTNTMRREMIGEKVLARTRNGDWYWRADTAEALGTKFAPEQLPLAKHSFSPESLVLQIKRKSKGGFTRAALDARLRELGVRDVNAMRARMLHRELLNTPDGGATWMVTNPREQMIRRHQEVTARFFLVKGRIAELPTDPTDRLLVLRWFADRLDRDDSYDDAQLGREWRYTFADLPALKRALLDAGLLVATDDGRYARPDGRAET